MNGENPFEQLRQLVLNLQSSEEANDQLIEAISLISEINHLYINISLKRDKVMTQLLETAERAKEKQVMCEELLHTCQLRADSNRSIIPNKVDIKDIKLPSIEEFQQQTGITDEELSRMTENEILYKRMDHEISKIPQIKEEFTLANSTRCELTEQLDKARKRYSPIISKMQKIYDEISGYIKKDNT
ncbi:hypothetical protein TRFO_01060 [Tritrichomonas foetus]|uniref:Uncharacterized protein n=1 Tax=Tritrichomonas foetus TaxID=1144522 RepID=A0A1J4KII4_9EUKA|nr:hypothetical protein TRFO_01060 [Tritrichomonas foetus]|eukprot:OHT11159.1 hypothetical protein TRFO_01060 [Tritrichomonas foetus]